MAKCELFKSIPLHVQKLNYKENVYELDDHVGEEALKSGLLLKFGFILQVFLVTYYKVMLESNPCFPMPCCPTTKGQNKTPLG